MTNKNNLSLRRMSQIRRGFGTWCTNSYMSDKTPSRCPLDASTGRSMVEMLGVLAIIGVLSVGAISGYSKAMFKYKLNKHTEQMNQVINAVARNAHNFANIALGKRLTETFIKMGEIPTEMVKKDDSLYIYDIFNQPWAIFISSEDKYIFLQSQLSLKTKSDNNLEICRNIITTAKENSSNIYYLVTISGYGTNDVKNSILFGDSYCGQDRLCLRNITLNNIYEMCTRHIGTQDAQFQITWRI